MTARNAFARLVGGRRGAIATAVAALLISPLFAPQLLAFPYQSRSGDRVIWSERPIAAAALDRMTARADALVSASPLARDREPRRIFLTEGGWRWLWLANTTRGSFALTRAFTDPVIIVNSSNLEGDTVRNGGGGTRRLSSVIAHETTHGMLRRHFGRVAMATKPQWLVEGYCDYVARESFLSTEEAMTLQARGETPPALTYFLGRRRIAALLEANGGDVDAVMNAYH